MSSQRLSARKAMKKEPADHDMEDADVDPPASKAKRGTKRPRKSSTAAPKKRGSAVKREEEDEDDDDDGEEEEETETTDHHWDDIRKGLMMDDQMHMPPLSPSMRGVIGPDDGMISDSALRDIKRESDDATRRLQDEVDRSYPNDDSGDDDDADESGPATKKRKGREKAETRDHKGLRHFSILVCEKLANLGTSTYKEIADQLVAEATISKSYVGYDEKNIRRRIYDALNVLMAMDIITKERKNIRWKGFEAAGGTGAVPGTAAAAANLQASPSGAGSKSASASRTAQSVAPLMASITAKKQTIASKKATLEELTLQYCGLRALLTRNKQLDAASAPNSNTANAAGSSNANGNGTANPSSNSASPSPPVADKLPWPFLVLAAPPGIPVECTTDDTREMVILTFAEPFAVHEHTQVLQYLGQHYVQHAPTVDTIQAKAGANANGTTAATNATSDSPFEQLVSAAAASPKLKSVPTSNSRRANSAQANASAAAAAAAANSALVTTNATPTADPRFSVPPAIWNLLPENSTLKKGAEAFAASVASQTAAATTANADDAFKAQAYKTLTGGNGLVNGTGATPSASVSPPALNASTPAAAAAPTPASTSKFANPFTQQPQLTAPAASNAQTSIDTATATTQ